MDIIDVMLARALTPQGQTETYASIAEAAAAKAEKAEQDAQAAIDTVTAAADTITETQLAADQLLETAQDALETAQQAMINVPTTEDIDEEVKKLRVTTNTVEGANANTLQVVTTYPDNTLNTQNITKMYKSEGNNEDGTMTQKAIKNYVDTSISNIPAPTGGTINFNTDEAGKIIAIGPDGNVIASEITEEELVAALVKTGTYVAENSVGLEIDYANKTFFRTQSAASLHAGSDFDDFIMYGGRMRCNVADDGTINAFYGDRNYREDGSNGQVMVYQPKFYYQRVPMRVDHTANGDIIRQESLILSTSPQIGFKLAPIFKSGDEELDYVLFSAYEGGLSNNKLTSIANIKPASNITIAEAESKANSRGAGWHIINMAAVSANQMLEIVEFGSMNGQHSLEAGICQINGVTNVNSASLTGSTAALGNMSGHAASTVNEISGNTTTYTEAGKRAISYRGIENPWGNIWHMIGGIHIQGGNQTLGGIPYICTDYNYTPGTIGDNYESIGFNLPSTYSWISAMGYGNSKYDWVFLPIECAASANSALPVGDNLWTLANTEGNRVLAIGGSYNLQDDVGPFYYASDRNISESSRYNYGTRLMFIPTKNLTYTSNLAKWNTKMGA